MAARRKLSNQLRHQRFCDHQIGIGQRFRDSCTAAVKAMDRADITAADHLTVGVRDLFLPFAEIRPGHH